MVISRFFKTILVGVSIWFFFLALAASLAEGVGILMLLPLIGVLDQSLAGIEDNRIGLVMQSLVGYLGLDESLLGVLLLLFAFFCLESIFFLFFF